MHSRGSASHGNLHLKHIHCQLALQLISILIDCNVFSHLHLFIKETFCSDPSHSRHLSPSLLCFMCWQCATTCKQEDTSVISPPAEICLMLNEIYLLEKRGKAVRFKGYWENKTIKTNNKSQSGMNLEWRGESLRKGRRVLSYIIYLTYLILNNISFMFSIRDPRLLPSSVKTKCHSEDKIINYLSFHLILNCIL